MPIAAEFEQAYQELVEGIQTNFIAHVAHEAKLRAGVKERDKRLKRIVQERDTVLARAAKKRDTQISEAKARQQATLKKAERKRKNAVQSFEAEQRNMISKADALLEKAQSALEEGRKILRRLQLPNSLLKMPSLKKKHNDALSLDAMLKNLQQAQSHAQSALFDLKESSEGLVLARGRRRVVVSLLQALGTVALLWLLTADRWLIGPIYDMMNNLYARGWSPLVLHGCLIFVAALMLYGIYASSPQDVIVPTGIVLLIVMVFFTPGAYIVGGIILAILITIGLFFAGFWGGVIGLIVVLWLLSEYADKIPPVLATALIGGSITFFGTFQSVDERSLLFHYFAEVLVFLVGFSAVVEFYHVAAKSALTWAGLTVLIFGIALWAVLWPPEGNRERLMRFS